MIKEIICDYNHSDYGARVVVDRQTGIVEKYFSVGALQKRPGLIKREVFWLKELESFDRTPKLISYDYDKNVVIMSYMGTPLTKKNIPSDFEQQIQYIVSEFEKFQCSHNDIKPTELLVLGGNINIIDFAWTTKIGEPIPVSYTHLTLPTICSV